MGTTFRLPLEKSTIGPPMEKILPTPTVALLHKTLGSQLSTVCSILRDEGA